MNAGAVPLSLYVHLPWCVRKCPYCDFNSHALVRPAPDPLYIDALLADFGRDLPLVAGRRIETLFLGGGTPSLFPPQEIGRLIDGLRQRIAFAPDAEVTLEANPGTVERGRFAGYRAAGVNRVSLGAQSFSGAALRALGRIHSPDDTRRAVEELRTAGIDNFNLDLMYALPGQSMAEAVADVEAAVALRPAHLSYYHLTLEPGTVFHARPPELPGEEAAWDMQEAGQLLLAGARLGQYEVSAYARDGAWCRHNLNYWQFGDYVGIGAGAHGKVTGADGVVVRTEKPRHPREYQESLQRVPPGEPVGLRRTVAPAELPFEFMLNALRLNAGFSEALFASRTGLGPQSIARPLAEAEKRRLIAPAVVAGEAGWVPTALGRRFLNDLQGLFLG